MVILEWRLGYREDLQGSLDPDCLYPWGVTIGGVCLFLFPDWVENEEW